MRAVTIAAVIVAALLAAWSQWQPQRSEDARQDALALLASNRTAAEAAANRAVSRDPLSAEALFTLADVQKEGRQHGVARATLQKAVRLQPSNPQTWLELARFDLASNPKAAVSEFQAAIYLNPELISTEAISPPNAQPESVEVYNDYIQALRASAVARSASESRARAGRAALRGSRRGLGSGLLGSQTPRSAG
jgi:tetratricopeptide (TPR) repeat protein